MRRHRTERTRRGADPKSAPRRFYSRRSFASQNLCGSPRRSGANFASRSLRSRLCPGARCSSSQKTRCATFFGSPVSIPKNSLTRLFREPCIYPKKLAARLFREPCYSFRPFGAPPSKREARGIGFPLLLKFNSASKTTLLRCGTQFASYLRLIVLSMTNRFAGVKVS